MAFQNDALSVQDQLQRGLINVDQANVLLVQCQGVRVVSGSLPAQVRKALNAAVKAGELGHIKKDGLRPEVYHHKNARPKALDEQSRIARESIELIAKIIAP